MRSHSVDSTIMLGFLQSESMEEYAEDAKHAPYAASEVREEAKVLEALKVEQETLKAKLHVATQKVENQQTELHNKISRNISYFQGVWGKTDKKIEKVGGHALEHHARHRKEEKVE